MDSKWWISSTHCYFPHPSYFQVFRGTITFAPDFDPSADAQTLYNAMKGIGECPLLLPSVMLKYQQAATLVVFSR